MSDKIELFVNNVMVFQQLGTGGVEPLPTGPTVPTGPTAPPPTTGDGLDEFRARQRVSQNCAWVLMTSAESGALVAKLGQGVYNRYAQFYTVGGTGSVAPNEVVDGNSPTNYSYWTVDQRLLSDVAQAADRYVEQRCREEGMPPPPPPANV